MTLLKPHPTASPWAASYWNKWAIRNPTVAGTPHATNLWQVNTVPSHWTCTASVPAKQSSLKNDMESTQQKINTQDYTNLGKQQLVGDLLYATILSYFALNNVQDAISAKQANMVSYKAPSYGIFKTTSHPCIGLAFPETLKSAV